MRLGLASTVVAFLTSGFFAATSAGFGLWIYDRVRGSLRSPLSNPAVGFAAAAGAAAGVGLLMWITSLGASRIETVDAP
jgi:hypothetical protein